MTGKKRFLIGGLGSLVPTLLNLVAVDGAALMQRIRWEELVAKHFDPKTTAIIVVPVIVGYVIGRGALFCLGGIWAWLDEKETSPVSVFQKGIIAPAILTALINAAHVQIPQTNVGKNPGRGTSISIISPVYAQELRLAQIKKFRPRNIGARFLDGLAATPATKTWFVIVGEHRSKDDAKAQAAEFNAKVKSIHADVYESIPGSKDYAVVIGEYLTSDEALARKNKAIQAGFTATQARQLP